MDLILPQKIIKDETVSNDRYGKFIADPLEPGFGQTLGNSLRRILLSSLEGGAVVGVKIEGVKHEFDAIPGVKEDVAEIVINLKLLRFKFLTPQPKKVTLEVKKKGEVRAEALKLPAGLILVNPESVIFNVDGATTVFLEADVRKGRGYEPIEKREAEDYPIGYIPVDAIFSPIRRVNYRVENTRVGRRTDYEKLIMEIWTDGSLMPEDALGYSASVLKNSLNVFIEFEKKGPSVDEIPSLSAGHEPQGLKDLLEQPIDVIELSVRALNCLRQAKINYIKDLITKDETKLLSYKNFGQKSLEEIKEKLAELAKARGIEISLGMKA